jgi:diaminohydroxyphosphoribosylaminopyrimidine deaminase/5-amino-6-(5-phosphoribosylamino)uracil reductase
VRVVVSTGGDLPLACRLVASARETPTIVLAERFAPGVAGELEARGVETVEIGAGGLRAGLALLAQRGLLEVLCEGGPGLAGALLADDLVDRLVLFVAPLVVGRGAPDLVALPAVDAIADARRLTNVTWETIGKDLLLRADVAPRGSDGVREATVLTLAAEGVDD